MKKLYKTIDLCAGIGGIRRGFELTGRFKNVMSAEIDKYACITYKHLYKDDAYNDLTKEEFKQRLENIRYDILLAGFPCQTFSRAGDEEGFDDQEKGIIFKHISEIIRRTKPIGVFLENVDNLVRHNNGNTFNIIITTLEKKLNYKVIGVQEGVKYNWRDFIRNSKNFGIPQNRPRTYIMAFSRNRFGNKLDKLTRLLPEKREGVPIYRDLNDLLEFGADVKYYMSERYLETLKKHRLQQHEKGNGFGYRIVNEKGIEHPVANTILATGGSGKERNLVYDKQKGVVGIKVPGKSSKTNSEYIRVMTPREWGKLQGFINYGFCDENGIDTFSFPKEISIAQQYKQFGNSVTIPVIESMAYFMLECLKQLKKM